MLIGCTEVQFPAEQRKAFIEVKRVADIELCTKKRKKIKCEKAATYVHQGSGAVIDRNSVGAFVLTAGHVCTEPKGLMEFFESNMITKKKKQELRVDAHMKLVDFEGQSYRGDIVANNEELDVCVMFAEHMKTKPLRRRYQDLTPGQKVYNIASPSGIFEPTLVPMLDGYYLGDRGNNTAWFTIPAVGGSSGSAILDADGRLAGMLHSVMRGFNHVSVATSLKELNNFIDKSISGYHESWYQNLLKMTRPKKSGD